MKLFIVTLSSIILFASCTASSDRITEGQDAKMKARIDSLIRLMSLDEKIGQLNLPAAGDIITGEASSSGVAQKIREGRVGGLFNVKSVSKIKEMQRIAVEESRLKIPLLFGMDVIHGYETVFPIPLALACTWDTAAIERSARIAAIEASADGICWTFSPMVDLCRDPRWGRIAEGSGEDPFLCSKIAEAMVRGYQGNDLSKDNTLMSCVKHFALYGASEAGRDYNTVDMSHIRMYNEYFPPYKAAVEAGAGSVMASFNEIDGVPATANKWLLSDVLRGQWKFDGFIVSDYTGISEMIDHGIGDLKTVAARALDAGLDMDMVSEGFAGTLQQSLSEETVTQAQIELACRRILEAKFKLGLFDDPYKYCKEERAKSEIYTDEHRSFARKTAAESFVLLKNNNDLLPLKKQGRIALIGPLADSRENMFGTWSVSANLQRGESLLEAMRKAAGDKATIVYAKGSNLIDDAEYEKNATMFGRAIKRDERSEQAIIDEAVRIVGNSDIVVAALGESSEMSGESSSRSNIEIPETQQKLLRAIVRTGKPVVLVLFAGRPLSLVWESENVPAILNVWFGGSEAASAISDVLFGEVNPCGKLAVSFPRNVGQIPVYYNHKNTGRPLNGNSFQKFRSNYLDVSNEPLYPFGYGLSYTKFTYGEIELNADTISADYELIASVAVTNTGSIAGKEVVQLYIRDLVGSITRPVKELKGFRKIFLQAGETQTVSFKIDRSLLEFYNSDLKLVCEDGEFELMIGSDSRSVKSARFVLTDSNR
ncbi:MAG: beta-glucosidase BglX [Prevotellaceae bacterium]|jgi:beta-glucosidase|nr:beta-glucosidase BglX [Prevotellaceae bacterium]